MRVQFLTLDAGPGGVCHPGQIVDVSDAEAAELVAGRFAAYVDRRPPVRENAVLHPPETAVPPQAQPRAPKERR